jgi:N-acetylneuraminic acid mutarotase
MREWSLPKTLGNAPSPRAGHTSILHGSSLYVFGGSSKKGPLNDLYRYDVENVKKKKKNN